jgi:long-subunit fatty acid transport protein
MSICTGRWKECEYMLKLLLVIAFCLVFESALADIGTLYGYSSRSSSLAGANKAHQMDAFSVLSNPALMSMSDESRFTAAFIGAYEEFADLNDVVVDNVFVGASSTEYGDVDTDVPDTLNYGIGLSVPIKKGQNRINVGLGFLAPIDKVMSPQTKDYFSPQYAMYLADTQRMSLGFGLAYKAGEKFRVGLAGQVYLNTGATVRARLPQKDDAMSGQKQTVTMNMKMDVRPSLAPIVGLHYELSENSLLAMSYAFERDYRVDFDFGTDIYLLGSPSALDFNGLGSLFYDPALASLNYSYLWARYALHFGIEAEFWSGFDGHVLKADFKSFRGSFYQYPQSSNHHDIYVPRLGFEMTLGKWQLRSGYAYRSSPVPGSSGKINFLDSDRHILGLGFGRVFRRMNWLEGPVEFDFHLQGQYLVPRRVDKLDPTDLGGPGYDIEGWVLGYGITLSKSM